MAQFVSSSLSAQRQVTAYDALSREAVLTLLIERDAALDEIRQELRSLAETVKKQNALIETLTQSIAKKDAMIKEKDEVIESLKEKLKAAQDRQFGVKSEKSARLKKKEPEEEASPQDRLFDEAESSDAVEEKEDDSPSKRKASGGRRPLPSSLPQEEVFYDLPESEKLCSCGSVLSCMGKKSFQTLEYVPAQLRVRTHHRLRYVCKSCEEIFRDAAAPPRVLPKTFASPSLLAHILVSKFDDH